MPLRLGALAVAALLVVGCEQIAGSAEGPTEVLAETARNLDDLDSGVLTLRFVATSDQEDAGPVGFELEGPFALAGERSELPVAELTYTQLAGDQSATARFISTGERAFIELEGQAYEFPAEQVESLRASGDDADERGLEELRIEDWVKNAQLSDGETVGGDETDAIAADLDVVAATNDLVELARSFAGADVAQLPTLEGEEAEQLENAVESANVQVLTGKDDRLLRRLRIDVRFAVDDIAELEALREILAAQVELELEIEDPNREVTVEEPDDALPFEELIPVVES